MKVGSYRLDIPYDKLRKYRKLLIQLPAGLKRYAREIVDEMEENLSSEIFLSSDTCFGACDIAVDTAKSLGVEAIVHFGHLPIPNIKPEIPVIFVNAVMDTNVNEVTRIISESVKERRLILVATAQHVDYLEDIRNKLNEIGLSVSVEEGDERIYKPGLVLGCNFSSANGDADAIVFIGTGKFHPIGLSLSTKKKIYAVDPISMEVRTPEEIEKERDRLLKKRYTLIGMCKSATDFGIIVSSKIGQNRVDRARELKDMIGKMGRRACILVMDKVEPDIIKDFGKFDCLISTACPRIAIDDADRFDVPIINPAEFEIAFGERDIEDYYLAL